MNPIWTKYSDFHKQHTEGKEYLLERDFTCIDMLVSAMMLSNIKSNDGIYFQVFLKSANGEGEKKIKACVF